MKYSLVRVRREMIVELERLRGRCAGRFVSHAGVHQERRRVFQRTRFTVGQTGRVRVVSVESLQFHRCQLKINIDYVLNISRGKQSTRGGQSADSCVVYRKYSRI